MHAALVAAGKRSAAADIRGFFPGTVLDSCMRRWLDQAEPKIGQMAKMVEDVIAAEEQDAKDTGDGIVRWKEPDPKKDKAEVTERCKAAAERLEVVLLKLVVPYDYQFGVRFTVPLTLPYLDGTPTKIKLVGEMDLLVYKGEPRYNVWDLKFTQDHEYWHKVTGQLLFYDVAVFLDKRVWPEQSGLIIPELDPPYVPFTFTAEDRRQVLHRIARYAEDVWRGDVSLAPKAATCRWCDTKHACPRFAPAQRGRVAIGGS